MSLAEAPFNTNYRICSFLPFDKYPEWYMAVGIRPGTTAKVICRHPACQPKYVEVELGNGLLLTLPFELAEDVAVEAA